MINNLGDAPSPELQIHFGVLQIDTENSDTGPFYTLAEAQNTKLQTIFQAETFLSLPAFPFLP